MANKTTTTRSLWTQLCDSPFVGNCARSPVICNDDIILSRFNDKYLYFFNTKLKEWDKHYVKECCKFSWHSKCINKDKTKLYLFDGTDKILLILDITRKKVKIIKQIKHSLYTATCPAIMIDPNNDNILHIIGGLGNNKHFTLNVNNGDFKIIHKFQSVDALYCPAIIPVSDKNGFYLIHDKISMHFYDLNRKTWINAHITMPTKIRCFGYIITPNSKYIVLFSGYKVENGMKSDDILVFDLQKMEYYVSKIKAPKCCYMNAVLTETGNIHLFGFEKHWKMNINAAYLLVFGYIKQSKIDIPNDITNQIVPFFGFLKRKTTMIKLL